MKHKYRPYCRRRRTTAEQRANCDPEVQKYVRGTRRPRHLSGHRYGKISRYGEKSWKELREKKFHGCKRIKHCLVIRIKKLRRRAFLPRFFLWENAHRHPNAHFRQRNETSRSDRGVWTIQITWHSDEKTDLVDEVLNEMGLCRYEIEILSIKYNNKPLEIKPKSQIRS